MGSKEMMENDEVECLLANMIYKVSFGLIGVEVLLMV